MPPQKQASINSEQIERRLKRLLESDPLLNPYAKIIRRRLSKVAALKTQLTGGKITLSDFASGHEYFGLHFKNNQWIFREWAPNAEQIFLIGDMTGWQENETFALNRLNEDGVWEIRLEAGELKHLDLYRLRVHWRGGQGDRIPAYARRVVQDPTTLIFNAQIWLPDKPYQWRHGDFHPPNKAPLIYEAHIGMAQEEAKIGSFREFTAGILPRIVKSGYNTIQLMAVQEHPYYGSFGYQVSNFFAASSRFGTPDDLKALIDEAHGAGLVVLMDIIHSHAVTNETEGLSRFDGTLYQYFHDGPRGRHELWDSRCFDYGKHQVLHFLLSNCRFWLDEYHFDGFRFDGITSMLYLHHGMNMAFTSYDDYFGDSVDEDALAYLALAGELIHTVRPEARTIAEDVSGMPGLAAPLDRGGYGFDYRFAMGVPDNWIKLIKEVPDDDWPISHLWYELTNRRAEEKTISYAESHDQALVGDKSIIFRLIDADMYEHMQAEDQNIRVDRGIALHKMIRLITLATAGAGYLNFMGNEFGHPEWIDFPREGNNWSCQYARRQWHLADDPRLKYKFLAGFDQDMIALANKFQLLDTTGPKLVYEHTDNKILIFERAGLLFTFNFHPVQSYSDYRFETLPGKYKMILNTDAARYGGHRRLQPHQEHLTGFEVVANHKSCFLSLYLPARSAQVLWCLEKN
ncbi:MAG: alpha amylase C-terminal domain-containing protein [Desulfobacterales bacterium]|jgi:1,4-alpha-glucan branching enzyme